MSTVGIKVNVDTTISNKKSNIASFYKAFSSESMNIVLPKKLEGGEYVEYEITENDFIIVVADNYGLENEVLDLTFEDESLNGPMTFKNVGFMMTNCFNMDMVTIKNTSEEVVELTVIF